MKFTVAPGLFLVALFAPAAAAQETMYGLSGNVFPVLQKLDPATGAVLDSHSVSGQEALFGGLAGGAGPRLFSIDGYNDNNPDRLFSIDPSTGAGAVVGPTGFNWNFRTVCYNPANGTLYGATDNTLYTINTATGAATVVGSFSATNLDQMTALAIDSHGQGFFTDIGSTDLFSINLATAQATYIGTVGQSQNWFNDLAFDSAGVLWGCRLNGGVYTIDLGTAQQTFKFNGNFTGLVFVGGAAPCYANCDGSTIPPILNVNDFVCFQTKYAAGDTGANCDGSTVPPILNVNDFICFQTKFAAGCP